MRVFRALGHNNRVLEVGRVRVWWRPNACKPYFYHKYGTWCAGALWVSAMMFDA